MPAPRALFLGRMYAGHRTRFLNLQAHTSTDPRIRPVYRSVTGWKNNGLIESAPLIAGAVRGRLRAALEAAAIASMPRPDVIWTSAGEALAPYLWSQRGSLRRPLVLDLDWTLEQQEQLAPFYFGRPPKSGVRAAIARLQERALWRAVTLFTPWSNWAAASLKRQGIPDDRIRVLPPGVDLEQWQPSSHRRPPGRPLRLLFVGGDFARKGGPIVLDAVRARFAGACELDIVTREAVPSSPAVRVHTAEPNSPALRELYATADLFVMPTRAECFGIATVEALASGLPVIVGDVGGARDIVDHGVNGWLIQPTAAGLARALEQAIAQRDALPAMGAHGRRIAESRFDGRRNDGRVVDVLLAAAAFRGQGRS